PQHWLPGAYHLLPLEDDRSTGMARGRRGQELEHGQRGDRLARAALAHERHRLPAIDVERHAAHGRHLPVRRIEAHGQVPDLQQGRRASALRGSKASRTASPMKMSRLSMTASTRKPVMPSQGACRLALPWARISPREGDPGGSPKPRKSSEVSVVMEPFRMN